MRLAQGIRAHGSFMGGVWKPPRNSPPANGVHSWWFWSIPSTTNTEVESTQTFFALGRNDGHVPTFWLLLPRLKPPFCKPEPPTHPNQVPLPRPPNVPLLRALWSLLDSIRGVLKGSWGVVVIVARQNVFGPSGPGKE